MKKNFLFTLLIVLLCSTPFVSFAKDSWEIQNGDPQLTNFNPITLTNDLFLKHELELGAIGHPSSMVVNGDTLYGIGSANTTLYALSLDTKAIKWEFTPVGSEEIRDIAIVNGHVAVLTAERLYYLSDDGKNKTIVWEQIVGGYSLSFGENTIYTLKGGTITSVASQSGEINWTYSIGYGAGEIFHSPVVTGTDKIYFVTDNQRMMERKLYALNLNGQVLWTTNVDYYAMYPMLSGGKIYTSSLTEVFAYDATTGRYLWRKPLDSAYYPQRENVFSSNEDTLFTRTTKGELWAFEAANGNVRYKKSFVEPRLSPYSSGPILVTTNEVILENAGKIKLFNSGTGEQTRTLAIPNVRMKPVAVTDRYLIAASDTKVYLYALPSDPQFEEPSGDPEPIPEPSPPQGDENIHVVQPGDTLWKIASQYGVTIQQIIERNQLDPSHYLWVGQNIVIPKAQTIYTVQSGDNLWKIANQYQTTIKAIIDKNNLDPTSYLWVGQKLIMPEGLTIHTVAPGDTLWKISVQYKTTIQAIATENQLDPSAYIWVGQRLIIPK